MDIKKKVLSSLKWTISSAFIQAVLQFAKLAILTRFLSASDFGLMAIILMVIGIADLFKDWGTSSALIHYQNVSQQQLSSLYWLNVFMGLMLSIVISGISPFIASFFEDHQLALLIPITSCALFIHAFGQQYSILFRKELQFNILESIAFAIKVIDFISVVLLAYFGFGIWALVIAHLIGAISSSLLYFFYGKQYHRPHFYFNLDDIRPFLSFGLYQMGSNLLNMLNVNLDKIIIGKYFGTDILGFYNLAWQLVLYPKNKINPIINKIAFPLFSKLQKKPQAFQNYYTFFLQTLSLFCIPLFFFLALFPEGIVSFLFGNQWSTSAQLLPFLAIIGLIKMLSNPGGSILLSKGKANIEFWWNLFWLLSLTIILTGGISYKEDIFFITNLLLTTYLFGFIIWNYLISHYGKIHYLSIMKSFLKASLTSSLCLSITFYTSRIVDITDSQLLIILQIISFITLYTISALFTERVFIKKLTNLLKETFK